MVNWSSILCNSTWKDKKYLSLLISNHWSKKVFCNSCNNFYTKRICDISNLVILSNLKYPSIKWKKNLSHDLLIKQLLYSCADQKKNKKIIWIHFFVTSFSLTYPTVKFILQMIYYYGFIFIFYNTLMSNIIHYFIYQRKATVINVFYF